MKAGLLIVRHDNLKVYSPGKRFRFAIVNIDIEGGYPANFVCMLPTNVSPAEKPSNFAQIFGDNSLKLAKRLLTGAYKKEQDSEVKAEIERRLEMLEPKQPRQIRCSSCGKVFHPRRIRRYSKNLCEECLRKRYASRE